MDVETIVIGAGVIGLAVARRLAISGRQVLVLEKNSTFGQEISARNSEVIHAGIYYPSNSLKAQLCVKGNRLLYGYCLSHKISHQRIGKLIVANNEGEISRLESTYSQGIANGVNDLEILNRSELFVKEPALTAVKAIFSPSTGIIDSHELMFSFIADIEKNAGQVVYRSPIRKINYQQGQYVLTTGGESPCEISCKEVINCGGLEAPSISHTFSEFNKATIPRQYLCRGHYFSLRCKSPFHHLVYPLPSDQGLGVHLTLDLAGRAKFGPDTDWINTVDYAFDASRIDSFVQSIKFYYPEIKSEKLMPGYCGIRPKLSPQNGKVADFSIQGCAIHGQPRYVALYGMESPGLTACLAIGEEVLARL